MKISVVSGGFDPLHSGHINLLKSAKSLGDKLVVLVNSDNWLSRKKGKAFMPWEERSAIIDAMEIVDYVRPVDDNDNSVTQGLIDVRNEFGKENEYVFCNGGDRKKDNIPEMAVEGYTFKFSVGGDNKANSSSWILKEWQYPNEHRVWGKFSTLFQDDTVKVKELIIEPGQGISYQRHFKRSEIWLVSKGELNVKHSFRHHTAYRIHTLKKDDVFTVHQGDWHQAYNTSNEPCHIIEIQFGSETSEDDIERLEYYNSEKDTHPQ
jgi:cytidyltransferase-like protein